MQRKWLIAASMIFFITGLLVVLADWWSVTPNGSDIPKIAMDVLAGIGLAVIPLAAALCLFGRTRPMASKCLIACVLMFASIAISSPIGRRIRTDGFQKIADRGAPLVDGIKAFIQDKGEPPESLDDLVPDYLQSIPTTGMAAYPGYRYWQNERRNTWTVAVSVCSGLDWGSVVYWSSEDYPKSLRRYGNWAYIPD
ncbi:MAG TPA: hypothetical protein PKN33_08985 [Phycisphaerae bacterium]|nr:hypothetical protein [Phycisphaerae bacterium]